MTYHRLLFVLFSFFLLSCGSVQSGDDVDAGDPCNDTNIACGTHGSCVVDNNNAPSCECESGYAGAACEVCDTGFQDNDGDAICSLNCIGANEDCSGNGVCSDITGAPVCTCELGFGGESCASCDNGFQDANGDGECAACSEAPFFATEFLTRKSLVIINSGNEPLLPGTLIRFVFDHAAAVTATESLPTGDDVRVVFFDGTNNTEIPRRSDIGFNSVNTDVFFKLVVELAPGEISTDYWIYSNNQAIEAPAADPFPLLNSVAIDTTDGVPLDCAPKAAGFRSIQLRQIGDTEYEVHNREHTGDSSSFGSVTITNDDDSDNVLFAATFAELGGSCCSPVVDGFEDQPVTITSSNFTVKLESREFSNSRRFFGCIGFGTSNPTLQGSTTRSYTVIPAAARIPAAVCTQE